jgi:hypothetical protein
MLITLMLHDGDDREHVDDDLSVAVGGLQEHFVTRKGFAFNADKPGMMEQQVRTTRWLIIVHAPIV